MPRHFIKLAYNGTNFHGWQIQDNAKTVQGELNNALSLLLREEINTTGCGRTDTGVNASCFYAHFDAENLIDNLVYKLNSLLPNSIVVVHILDVSPEAHARFDAKSRTYHYFFHNRANPFLGKFSYYVPLEIDVQIMNQACKFLLKTKDFTSFSKIHTDTFTNNCTVTQAQIIEIEKGKYRFEITADRFLRNMVRAIMGTLLQVGKGKVTLAQFQEIIDSHDRGNAGKSVDGEALFLAMVEYEYID
jgi:tRNA pseudouridine38-40 synthase